jgi:hypothetical protein
MKRNSSVFLKIKYRKPRSKYHVHDIKLISHHEIYFHEYLLIHIKMGGVYDYIKHYKQAINIFSQLRLQTTARGRLYMNAVLFARPSWCH